ncbi:MAG: serine/threonine-protein kinase [Kofleriaceae bacterium]
MSSPSGAEHPDTALPTAQLPAGEIPAVAPLARIAAGLPPAAEPTPAVASASDALRHEEIERTRLFIRMGWLLSVVAIATVPFVAAPRAMSIAFVGGLVIGLIASFAYHQAFADPTRYTERALVSLSVLCTINGHLGVLFYGAYTAAPLMVVVGIHFVARTEAERVARWILYSAIGAYAAIAIAITSGWIADPGVFASDREVDRATLITGAVFVLGAFVIAYWTARVFRVASLVAIEDLRGATRIASEREALMDELRGELARALRIGGPGRYTEQVVGRFRLGVVIGRGAMGEVYDATEIETGAPAAVKLLRRELLADPSQIARFLREARAGGALDSPHAVRVLEASPDDAALPYLAMERLHGVTLAERLRGEPRLSSAATLELCRHAAAGIDAAAEAGIVHRDLKPQNLFHHREQTWKVLDFGVATLASDHGTLTRGGIVGTPHYMAPEQAQGRPVDRRADLYAIAAIAYRCLTGRHPFHAADTPSLLYAVVHRMPARPGALAELPDDVDRWFALALAKSPDDRFATGGELVGALADALAGALDPRIRRRADALVRAMPWEPA